MSESKLTPFPLLGLLTWHPMSGYELKKTIEQSVGYFWSESFGQIYPELKRMESLNWVTATDADDGKRRPRREYSITDAGRDVLARWLVDPPTERPQRNELLLKLFFAGEADLAATVRHVEIAREQNTDLTDQYRNLLAQLEADHADHPGLPFWRMTLRYGICHREATTAWCEETLEILQELLEREDDDGNVNS